MAGGRGGTGEGQGGDAVKAQNLRGEHLRGWDPRPLRRVPWLEGTGVSEPRAGSCGAGTLASERGAGVSEGNECWKNYKVNLFTATGMGYPCWSRALLEWWHWEPESTLEEASPFSFLHPCSLPLLTLWAEPSLKQLAEQK